MLQVPVKVYTPYHGHQTFGDSTAMKSKLKQFSQNVKNTKLVQALLLAIKSLWLLLGVILSFVRNAYKILAILSTAVTLTTLFILYNEIYSKVNSIVSSISNRTI